MKLWRDAPWGTALLVACALAQALGGCGYALVGKGVTVDKSIRKIGVPQFRDLTGRPGLAQKVSQAVVEELLKRGNWEVVTQSTEVDALLDAELTNYSVVPVGFGNIGDQTTGSTRYSIVLSARATYSKTGVSEPMWQNDSFSEKDDYDVGEDPGTFVDREDQALDRLVQAFARKLVAEMLEAF